MPKVDPGTGCTVLTTAEFWQKEAEHEGKGRTAGELQSEFFDEMEEDRLRSENELREPQKALERLQEAVKFYNECDSETQIAIPESIVEVLDVKVGIGLRESSELVVATCIRSDTKQPDKLTLESWNTPGSMYEPPDGDTNVWWESDLQKLKAAAVKEYNETVEADLPLAISTNCDCKGKT